MKYLDEEGLNTLVKNIKDHVHDTIEDGFNQVVTEKNILVKSKQDNTINEYTISCLLNGSTLKAISLSDIAPIEYQKTRKSIWTKTAEQGKCYAGIFAAGSTAGSGVLKLTINNTQNNKSEKHYICFIEDTPANGTFLFSTTCEWNIETRFADNYLFSYLEIPSSFIGIISIEPVMCNINTGGGWYSFEHESVNNTPRNMISYYDKNSSKLFTDDVSMNIPLIESEPHGKKLTTDYFIAPFGYHKTDIIYDFGSIKVGDKISDTVINDCLIHNIDKRLTSINSSISANNNIIADLKIYDNKLFLIAPIGSIIPDKDAVQFARYTRTNSRYVLYDENGKNEIKRKKSGWITPRIEKGDAANLIELVVFFLNPASNLIYVPAGYEAFLLGVSINNTRDAHHVRGIYNNITDGVAQYFFEAHKNVYVTGENSNSVYPMKFIDKKCGIRIMRDVNGNLIPISDFMKFMVQIDNAGNPHLCRWK